MSDLLSALLQAGVVSPDQASSTKAIKNFEEEQAAQAALQALTGSTDTEETRRMNLLTHTGSVTQFRTEAHKLLILAPECIGSVVALAHEEKKSFKTKPGGKWLIANLLTLRNTLATTKDEEKAALVKKMLPKH